MLRCLPLLLLCGCGLTLRQLSEMEDRRAALDVEPYTRIADARLRQRAMLALGRIQDPRTAGSIAVGLTDSVSDVRAEAAFAAGLLGLSWYPLTPDVKAVLQDALLAALVAETDAKARLAEIDALGRVGTEPALARLRQLDHPRMVLSLGVAVKRGAKLAPGSIDWQKAWAADHYGAAYLAAMIKLPEARALLRDGLQDENPEVRALCAKGLGDVGEASDTPALHMLLEDPDVRVAVEAVRALVKQKVEAENLHGRPPVILAAAQAGQPVMVREPKLFCRGAMAADRRAGVLNYSLACPDMLGLALHELALGPPKSAQNLGEYLKHKESRVRLGALDAIGEAKAAQFIADIRPLLKSDDAVEWAAAALTLAKLGDRESIATMRSLTERVLAGHEDVAPSISEALTTLDAKEAVPELMKWLQSSNATVRHSALAALGKLTGQTLLAPDVPLPRYSPLPETGSKLLLTTERGEVTIELWNDEAPRSAGNLWSLAKRGYFDGLTFHRIVPDFVAQAGDPRGDGEGGPGYMIRCEMGHRPYVRGTVGMALSGKDTGGSQFFITHTATPHLDGRYTAFGQVTQGMDAVDALLEGDKILKVTALP